jgi:hypothetical protein
MKRLLLICLCCWPLLTLAHKGSDAYLQLHETPQAGEVPRLGLRLSVALKDLDLVLPIDADSDTRITWAEVQAAVPALLALVSQEVQFKAAPDLLWRLDGLEARGDGAYVRLAAEFSRAKPEALMLRYGLLSDVDSSHRLQVQGDVSGQPVLLSLAPGLAQQTVNQTGDEGGGAAKWRSLGQHVELGFVHLMQGYDHLAFLMALVIPLRLRLRWSPPLPDGHNWGELLRTVTAFTAGHSLTLALATLGYVSVSTVWVEPVIALSVAAAALLNIYPLRQGRRFWLAGLFGLIHGLGFAGLLVESDVPQALLGWALLGFNIGLEVAQLLAVGLWALIAQPLMWRGRYGQVVQCAASWVLVVLAMYWFVQRLP